MLTAIETKPLGQLLIGRGFLQPGQLDSALQLQGAGGRRKLLGEILIEQKWCSPEQIAEALAFSCGIPFARITPKLADPKVIATLPAEFLERNRVLPLFKVEGVLTVAAAEPTDVLLVEEIARLTRCRVQIVGATAENIAQTLQTYLPRDAAFAVDEIVDEKDASAFALARIPGASCELAAARDPAILKLIQYSICAAVQQRATEIHFDPGEHDFRLRHRIDGRLVEKRRPPMTLQPPLIYRIKWMAELNPDQCRKPQTGVMKLLIDGRTVAMTVTTAPTRNGEKVVLRIADAERKPLPLEKLGFSYEMFKQWRKLIASPQGLVLVSGPSGGGKRTTLYSCLREFNALDQNVCAVEDPVEASLPGVNQVQIDGAIGLDFPAAVESVLAQSPDVLMISDLRDRQTSRLAAQAGMDGHLVLAGASAADAVATIAWLLNLGIEPYLLGSALTGVLAQRLVRKLCQSCKEPYQPGAGVRRQLEKHLGAIETLYRARGCDRCANLGYRGRIGVYELLVPDEHFRQRLSQGANPAELRELAAAAGLKPLRLDALEKARNGITTLDEAYRVDA